MWYTLKTICGEVLGDMNKQDKVEQKQAAHTMYTIKQESFKT